MSTEQLIAEAMALPLAERVSLAQALWRALMRDCRIQRNVLPLMRLSSAMKNFRQAK